MGGYRWTHFSLHPTFYKDILQSKVHVITDQKRTVGMSLLRALAPLNTMHSRLFRGEHDREGLDFGGGSIGAGEVMGAQEDKGKPIQLPLGSHLYPFILSSLSVRCGRVFFSC